MNSDSLEYLPVSVNSSYLMGDFPLECHYPPENHLNTHKNVSNSPSRSQICDPPEHGVWNSRYLPVYTDVLSEKNERTRCRDWIHISIHCMQWESNIEIIEIDELKTTLTMRDQWSFEYLKLVIWWWWRWLRRIDDDNDGDDDDHIMAMSDYDWSNRVHQNVSLHISFLIFYGSLIGCIILLPQEVVLRLVTKILFPAEVVLCSQSSPPLIPENTRNVILLMNLIQPRSIPMQKIDMSYTPGDGVRSVGYQQPIEDDVTWLSMTWHDMTEHYMAWHDMESWHGMTWHGIIWSKIREHANRNSTLCNV